MIDAVRETVLNRGMLEPGDKIIAGVSGGADSVAMLHVLLQLKEEFDLNIFAAHVNHGLRGEESDADERFVFELCRERGVELSIYRADVKKTAAENNLTLEEAGRQCRYAFFNSVLKEKAAHKIAVAHNLNDNAETVVLNLCRGTGLAGLCGIPPVRGKIIRPLIERTRAEIEKYLSENNIPFRTDSTNLTDEFTRGRVRLNVLPVLAAQVNGNAVKNIARNTAVLRAEDEFLEAEAERAYLKASYLNDSGSTVILEIPSLKKNHPAVIRRAIRRAYEACAGTVKDLTNIHVEQILNLPEGNTGRKIFLPANVTARREYAKLIFERASENLSAGAFSFPLEWDVPVNIPACGKTVKISLAPPSKISENACTKAFRYDRVSDTLFLRTRLPGDRIFFKGTGTRKLQDYFTDRKIPRGKRDSIPLLACGGEILWIMDEANRVNGNYISTGERPPDEEKIFYATSVMPRVDTV